MRHYGMAQSVPRWHVYDNQKISCLMHIEEFSIQLTPVSHSWMSARQFAFCKMTKITLYY